GRAGRGGRGVAAAPRGCCACRRRGHGRSFSGFFFSSRRRHTRFSRDWSSDVCSSDLEAEARGARIHGGLGMLLHQAALAFEKWIDRKSVVQGKSGALGGRRSSTTKRRRGGAARTGAGAGALW